MFFNIFAFVIFRFSCSLWSVQVENPSCIWGRVMGASSLSAAYNSLLTEMNLFYHDVSQDLHSLTPVTLKEGQVTCILLSSTQEERRWFNLKLCISLQVCVVLWAKSWCRAVVESMVMDSMSDRALCFLVDHGERLIAPIQQ